MHPGLPGGRHRRRGQADAHHHRCRMHRLRTVCRALSGGLHQYAGHRRKDHQLEMEISRVRPELCEMRLAARRRAFDGTTDMTTSHLTNPAKYAGQVIGYSHSTRLSAEELLAGHPKDDNQVAGYGRAPE